MSLRQVLTANECGDENPLASLAHNVMAGTELSSAPKPFFSVPKFERTQSGFLESVNKNQIPQTEVDFQHFLYSFISSSRNGVPFQPSAVSLPTLTPQQQTAFARRSAMLCKSIGVPLQHMRLLNSLHIDSTALNGKQNIGWEVGQFQGEFERAWSSIAPHAWTEEFVTQQQNMHREWTNEFQNFRQSKDWSEDYLNFSFEQIWDQTRQNTMLEKESVKKVRTKEEEAKETDDLQKMALSFYSVTKDPIVGETNFVRTMSKIAEGSVKIRDNELIETEEERLQIPLFADPQEGLFGTPPEDPQFPTENYAQAILSAQEKALSIAREEQARQEELNAILAREKRQNFSEEFSL